VSAHVLVLGVLSGLRPATAQAAVLALLRGSSPRRMLLAYCLVGFTWCLAVGVLVIVVFDGVGSQFGRHRSDFTAVFDLLAGVAALGFAAGVARGQLLQRIQDRRPASNGDSRLLRRLREPSLIDAGVAGVATHVPGLIYLVVLNAIAAADIGTGTAMFQLSVYNLLWFAFPITALGLALTNPAMISDALERSGAWATRNRDRLVVALFGGLGIYLVAKGVVELLR
jgi:Sap, sulfolipid-1-addressing protein